MLLNYTFLKELPTYMCQILDYVCPCKFEKKTFSPKMDDVLGTMLTIFDSWRKSLESFEDIDAVKYRKTYHAPVIRTPVADKEIMERLGLEELPDLTFRPMEKAEPVYIKRHQYMWVHEQ